MKRIPDGMLYVMREVISMKKENYYKFMYVISALLAAGFLIRLGADSYKYDPVATSAPFYVCIIVRALEYIIPCILVFIAGLVCKKKL